MIPADGEEGAHEEEARGCLASERHAQAHDLFLSFEGTSVDLRTNSLRLGPDHELCFPRIDPPPVTVVAFAATLFVLLARCQPPLF